MEKQNTPLFDASNLLHRIGGDRQLVKEILLEFLQDLPIRLESLKESILQNDLIQVRRHAHSVKGAAMNIVAPALIEIASQLESSARKGQKKEFETLVPQLEQQFQLLKVEIEEFE